MESLILSKHDEGNEVLSMVLNIERSWSGRLESLVIIDFRCYLISPINGTRMWVTSFRGQATEPYFG